MSSKTLIKIALLFTVFLLAGACYGLGPGAYYRSPDIVASEPPIERNPFRPAPNPLKAVEPEMPELYIGTTLRQGLNEVLPPSFRKGLDFGASYDSAAGLPTIQFDYFLPIRAWNDKSIFLTPRASLSGAKETFSMGFGFRQLYGHNLMIGFHTFHDWTRPRREGGRFLNEAGAGIELAALPGKYSDLAFSLNAYLPVNEKQAWSGDGEMLAREALCRGIDARLGFTLPELVNWLDIRLDARAHSYQGSATVDTGYSAAISVATRDGMFRASFERETDNRRGEQYRIEGTLNLAFDWNDLLQNDIPFSAPYRVPQNRYCRKIQDTLTDRVSRKHDMPTDRTENRVTLAARVSDRTVFLSGGFPDLPNSRVTIQVSHSPWQDWADLVTDSSGFYSGAVNLPPGSYHVRLIHKPTGRRSTERTVVVRGKRQKSN